MCVCVCVCVLAFISLCVVERGRVYRRTNLVTLKLLNHHNPVDSTLVEGNRDRE